MDRRPRLLAHRVHLWATANEFSVTDPDERKQTVAKEVESLKAQRADPDKLALVAEVDALAEDVAGACVIRAGDRRRIAHGAELGISVHECVRNLGVGRAMMHAMLDWARAHPTIEKVTLGVFATNARAIHLYRAVGFEEEGRREKYFKFGPGQYVDDVQMRLWVKVPATVRSP